MKTLKSLMVFVLVMFATFSIAKPILSSQEQADVIKLLKEQKDLIETQSKFISSALQKVSQEKDMLAAETKETKPLSDPAINEITKKRDDYKKKSFDVLAASLKYTSPANLDKKIEKAQEALNDLEDVVRKNIKEVDTKKEPKKTKKIDKPKKPVKKEKISKPKFKSIDTKKPKKAVTKKTPSMPTIKTKKTTVKKAVKPVAKKTYSMPTVKTKKSVKPSMPTVKKETKSTTKKAVAKKTTYSTPTVKKSTTKTTKPAAKKTTTPKKATETKSDDMSLDDIDFDDISMPS